LKDITVSRNKSATAMEDVCAAHGSSGIVSPNVSQNHYLGSGALLVKYEFGVAVASEAQEIRPDAGHAA
jgi:hypothetical protein